MNLCLVPFIDTSPIAMGLMPSDFLVNSRILPALIKKSGRKRPIELGCYYRQLTTELVMIRVRLLPV